MTHAGDNHAPEPPIEGRGRSRDEAYEFGRLPRSVAHSPFSTREFARLLVLRGRVRDRLVASDDWGASEQMAQPPADARTGADDRHAATK